MHTHSPNWPKTFKQTSARNLMETFFWDRRGVLMLKFMQQGTKMMSEVYRETPKNCVRPFRTKGVEY
jgi:hypothetical protein